MTVPFSLWVSDSTAYQRDVGVCHRLQRNSHGCNLGLSLHILYSLLSICHNDSLIIQYENYVLPTVPKYDSWNAEMFSKTRELHGLFSREKKKKRHPLVLEEVSSSQGFTFCISKFRKQSLPLQWAKALAGPWRREAKSYTHELKCKEGWRCWPGQRPAGDLESGTYCFSCSTVARWEALVSKEMKNWRETTVSLSWLSLDKATKLCCCLGVGVRNTAFLCLEIFCLLLKIVFCIHGLWSEQQCKLLLVLISFRTLSNRLWETVYHVSKSFSQKWYLNFNGKLHTMNWASKMNHKRLE